MALCNCNCLFDIDYEIINLQPGEYTIKIIEPYLEPYLKYGEEILKFTVDLSSSTSGSYCAGRNYYP